MPIIEMHLMEGRSDEQKRSVATAITKAVTQSLGVQAETVRILITEHDGHGFFVAGKTMAERKKEKDAALKEEKTQ